MRLIDADKLISHLSDYMLQVSPDETMSMTNDFSEYNLHQIMCETINDCIEAVKESETVSVEVRTGYHGSCLQPKGSFKKIYQDCAELNEEKIDIYNAWDDES